MSLADELIAAVILLETYNASIERVRTLGLRAHYDAAIAMRDEQKATVDYLRKKIDANAKTCAALEMNAVKMPANDWSQSFQAQTV